MLLYGIQFLDSPKALRPCAVWGNIHAVDVDPKPLNPKPLSPNPILGAAKNSVTSLPVAEES